MAAIECRRSSNLGLVHYSSMDDEQPTQPVIKVNNTYMDHVYDRIITIPQLGFGCFAYSETLSGGIAGMQHEFKHSVLAALEAGYRHFDTAMLYSNEGQVGEVLSEAIAEGKVTREELFITSKIPMFFMKYAIAKDAIEHINETIGLGYVDLVLIHFPFAIESASIDELSTAISDMGGRENEDTDYLETWQAMEEAVEAGLVRSIGLSNFNAEQVQRVLDNCIVKPVTNQVECHPAFPQTKLKEFLDQKGITLTAFSPLQNPSFHAHKLGNLFEAKEITDAAVAHNKTAAQIILRWHIQRGNIVIPKSGNPQRIKENMDIFDFQLSSSEMSEIATLDQGKDGRHFKGLGGSSIENHMHYPYNAEF